MTQFWLWVACIGLTIGAIYFAGKAFSARRKEGMEFALSHFFIALWAAINYYAMITGLTVTEVFGQEVYWGRYVDWAVTTPLLLISLGVIAGARPKLIAGVVGADLVMIITGLAATLAPPPTNYVWYLISSGAFLALLWALFSEYANTGNRRADSVTKLFHQQRNFLSIVWFGYPIIWILGAQGIDIIGTGIEALLYCIFDITAKVIYGFTVVSKSDTILARASDSERRMETAHSYINSEPSRR
jgi:bacteriorhodopsin